MAAATTAGGKGGFGRRDGSRWLAAAGLLVLGLVLVQMLAFAGSRVEPGSFALERFGLSFPGSDDAAAPSERQIAERVASAPVGFVANEGQAPESVSHLAQGPGYAFAFGREGVRVSLVKQQSAAAAAKGAATAGALSVGMEFVGANPAAKAELAGPAGGRVNYMVGERARWRAGLATYPVLVYRDLWPGIDMAFKGSQGKLKYEFRLAPGADPRQIQLAYQGAESLSLSSAGALQVRTERGVLKDATPVSYQRIDGRRVPVESSFALANGNSNGYGFTTGAYNHNRPLVIDPALEYSTYLGGASLDSGLDIVLKGHDAYVSGATFSPNFPTTSNAFDTSPNGSQDAFVSRIDTRKSGLASLEYSTVVGGSGPDAGLGLEVKGHDVYLAGFTGSPGDFPVTANAYQPFPHGGGDAFLTRIDTRNGSAGLEYSTNLGGSQLEVGLSIAVKGDDAFLTGLAMSPEFPVTANAFDTTFNGGVIDGFVAKIDTGKAGAAGLEYSTFLGGGGPDSGREIQVRGHHAYIAGPTGSPNFPVSANAFDTSFNGGGQDAFVTRLDTKKAGAAGLRYSTYLGGSGQEDTSDRPGTSIAVVGDNAYVASVTTSTDFPVTWNAYDRTHNGGQDAFLTRLDTGRDGAAGLRYSTYLGGSGDDIGRAVAVKGHDAYTTGGTKSSDFPLTGNAFDATPNGGQDAFVTRLDTRRWRKWGLEYSTYLGGSANELGRGIAVRRGHAYVTGETGSSNFPVTAGAFQPAFGGVGPCEPAPGTQSPPPPQCDAFVTRLDTRSKLVCPPGVTDPDYCEKKKHGHKRHGHKRHKRLRVDLLVRGDRGVPSGRLGTYTLRYKRR